MKRVLQLVLLLLFAATCMQGQERDAGTSSRSLFAQTARALLERRFANPDISYLLLDGDAGEILAARWPDINRPIPLGSLVKPFAAIAWAEGHPGGFPTHTCTPRTCWLPRGHGTLGIKDAIANSCNSYFRSLTRDIRLDKARLVAAHYSLPSPPNNAPATALVGMTGEWEISPVSIARAYFQLARERDHAGAAQVLAGMREAARTGTAALVGASLRGESVLAKTGTAACTHRQKGAGDGLTVVVYPADQPRLLLMVRVHGVPGHEASKAAAAMMRALEQHTAAAD